MTLARPRLFVLARHGESEANAAHVLNSDPARPAGLTPTGVIQAQALGAQLANLDVDVAIVSRFARVQATARIALAGRYVPIVVEPGFDEIDAGDLDGAPIERYWRWKELHFDSEPFPNGESVDHAVRRHAAALRRLLAQSDRVTFVVSHELALRQVLTAASPDPRSVAADPIPNAAPYLLDEPALRRAAEMLRRNGAETASWYLGL